MKKIIFSSLFCVIVASGLFITAHVTFAQKTSTKIVPPSASPTALPVITPGPFDYTASPDVLDITALPGSTVNEEISLYNHATVPNELKIDVKELVPDNNTGTIRINDFPASDPTQYWLTFKSKTFFAQPQEWTKVPFQITIPKNAGYGYYWAIVFSNLPTQTQLAKPFTTINGTLAVPILLVAQQPGIHYSGQLTRFDTDQTFYEYPPVTFRIDFSNQGNVHVRPAGNIFIKDWTGKIVARLDANTTGGSVLPGGIRTFFTTWDDSFITNEDTLVDGKPIYDVHGQPETKLAIHFDKLLNFRIGKYTATALVVVNTNGRDVPYQLTTSFFIFPWKIVVGVVLLVLLVLLGLTFSVRSAFQGVRRVVRKR